MPKFAVFYGDTTNDDTGYIQIVPAADHDAASAITQAVSPWCNFADAWSIEQLRGILADLESSDVRGHSRSLAWLAFENHPDRKDDEVDREQCREAVTLALAGGRA